MIGSSDFKNEIKHWIGGPAAAALWERVNPSLGTIPENGMKRKD